MAAPPPRPLYLKNHLSLLQTFSSFLTVAIHEILYQRGLYSTSTFITARAYNFPIHQSRHPSVCAWITSAVSSVQSQLTKGGVRRVAVVIYNPNCEVLERFMFDVERFPAVAREEQLTTFESREEEGVEMRGISVSDIEEQLRATVRKLAYCGEKLGELPDGCTFTVCVELKEEAEVPIGHPQAWVPSEPELQTWREGDSERVGRDLGGAKSTTVRAVEAGEFVMEAWIEEGAAKKLYQASPDVD